MYFPHQDKTLCGKWGAVRVKVYRGWPLLRKTWCAFLTHLPQFLTCLSPPEKRGKKNNFPRRLQDGSTYTCFVGREKQLLLSFWHLFPFLSLPSKPPALLLFIWGNKIKIRIQKGKHNYDKKGRWQGQRRLSHKSQVLTSTWDNSLPASSVLCPEM